MPDDAFKNGEDARLVRDLRAGKEEAFRLLLQKYLNPTFRFLVGLTHDPSAAEDLVQETFIKAWKHLGRFDPERSFKVWLFAIAKNTAYDFLRKKKALPFSAFENEDGENALERVPDLEDLPDEILERADLAAEVGLALQKIPADYRTLLLLVYEEGFSLVEAADILEEPYNTVKSRHRRAIFRLKKAILEDGRTDFASRA